MREGIRQEHPEQKKEEKNTDKKIGNFSEIAPDTKRTNLEGVKRKSKESDR